MIRHYTTVTKIRAPREVVWEVMSDHRRYADWSSAGEVVLDPPGDPDPHGVGAVREFRTGRFRVREEIVAFEPSECLAYRLRSGLPVRDHHSEMALEADDGPGGPVTVLTWRSSFRARLPLTGGLLERIMHRAVERFAEGIREAAEQAAGSRAA